MRVTSNSLRNLFLDTLQSSQRQMLENQNRIATGRRINSPADDPLGAARIAELDASLARLEQFDSNGLLARSRLGLEEETLVSAINHLQRARELAVQANSSTLGDADRQAIAVELRERLDGLVALANTVDASGQYLFAGFQEGTRPFTVGAAGVTYNGDQGARSLQIGDNRLVRVGDPGSEVFMRIPNGNGEFTLSANSANAGTGVLGAGTVSDFAAFVSDNYVIDFTSSTDFEVRDGVGGLVVAGTYAPGQTISFSGISIELDGEPVAGDQFMVAPSSSQDVFSTMQRLVGALEQPRPTPAARALLHTEVGQLLQDVDQSIERLIDVRADIGSRLRAIDDQSAINSGRAIALTETVSEIRDLDYAEAISLLSQQLIGLEAAQQSFVRIQGLSLFRFL